jgi:hypothetical protein
MQAAGLRDCTFTGIMGCLLANLKTFGNIGLAQPTPTVNILLNVLL